MTFAGELVTEELEYDGGRQVTAYLPPDSPEAVVFAGDGQLISRWGAGLGDATIFLENAAALRDASADVVMTERVGSHGDSFWREEFPLMWRGRLLDDLGDGGTSGLSTSGVSRSLSTLPHSI